MFYQLSILRVNGHPGEPDKYTIGHCCDTETVYGQEAARDILHGLGFDDEHLPELETINRNTLNAADCSTLAQMGVQVPPSHKGSPKRDDSDDVFLKIVTA